MVGGTLMTHNCLSMDYCVRESLKSLQGCCDEIVVVDAESNDGTLEWLRSEANKDSRIDIATAAWKPGIGGKWLSDLANVARRRLHSPYHVMLQADEVLHEAEYHIIRGAAQTMRSYRVHRLNFWKDAKHVAPHGVTCSHIVIRLAPSNMEAEGDAESLRASGPTELLPLRIFHYGFLRHLDQQIAKGIEMESAFLGSYNPVYDQMKAERSRKAFDECHGDRLLPINVQHPPIMKQWLSERGYG